MREVRDLGPVDDPILVFGGPYSNVQATLALLAEADRRGIPRHRRLCTGDVVAYCADPQAAVDVLRDAEVAVVMGNCEESLGSGAEDCGCGFEEGSACDLLSAQWYRYSVGMLRDDAKAWMRALPRHIALTMGGRRLLAIHGGVDRINRFVFPATPLAEKAEELDLAGADGIIAGHCGVPFTQLVDGRMWHNAGVIGMPANDGTPRVWYSILRPEDGGIVVEHHALSYDQAVAAARMRERGLPVGYADALVSGLWPADDIMPEADRSRRGRPLALEPVFWAR
jgi:predicted phosphodiesterase